MKRSGRLIRIFITVLLGIESVASHYSWATDCDVFGDSLIEVLKRNLGYYSGDFPPDFGLRYAQKFNIDGPVAGSTVEPYPDGQQLIEIGSSATTRVGILGNITRRYVDEHGNPVYLGFDKQAIKLMRAEDGGGFSEIPGQGLKQHPSGFSTPVGVPLGFSKPLEAYTATELQNDHKFLPGENLEINYPSGVKVVGVLEEIQVNAKGYVNVLKFKTGTTTVTFGKATLFRPSWGQYDMLVGAVVVNSQSAPPGLN